MMVYQGRHKGGTNGTGARPALCLLWEVGLPSHNLLLLCVGEGGRERGVGGKRERERKREVAGGGKKVGEGMVKRNNVKVFVVAWWPSPVVVFVFTARETRCQ